MYAEFTDLANYALFDDVIPVLERLRSAGLTLGIVSNFEEWLERLLERLGVRELFDVRVISGIEGVEKPDPRIFLLAMDRAGVEPTRSVYVGDNPALDIEPALAVGMFPVLVDRRDRYLDTPRSRISSLEELPASWGSRDRPHLHRRRGERSMLPDLRERLVRIRDARQVLLQTAELVTERVATDGGGSHGGREYWTHSRR